MLLHDSQFLSLNRSINSTHASSIVIVHSPLFRSTLTLVVSIFGTCSNLVCIIYLYLIISQYKKQKLKQNHFQKEKSFHVLSHDRYRFLIVLTTNDFLLCFSSIISCLDEKYFAQTLIAYYHLCSFHILVWKFTLHFTPLLIIFILSRYHYMLTRKFPPKYYNTTTYNQLFFTDLCLLIPFIIAFSWSVDGLWLWGETNLKRYVLPMTIDNNPNHTHDFTLTTSTNIHIEQNEQKYDDELYSYFSNSIEQENICYLQTNDDLDLIKRLVYLIRADFLLLFLLHFTGFLLEILLHVRLSCCLTSKRITSLFLREKQICLYILYIFITMTLTSLPFYFYRTAEVVFDSNTPFYNYDLINSRVLAQIILFGISFKPILYFILLFPSKMFFTFKCYTSINIERIDEIDDILLINRIARQNKDSLQHDRYSIRIKPMYSKCHIKLRSSSNPLAKIEHHHSDNNDAKPENIDVTDL